MFPHFSLAVSAIAGVLYLVLSRVATEAMVREELRRNPGLAMPLDDDSEQVARLAFAKMKEGDVEAFSITSKRMDELAKRKAERMMPRARIFVAQIAISVICYYGAKLVVEANGYQMGWLEAVVMVSTVVIASVSGPFIGWLGKNRGGI